MKYKTSFFLPTRKGSERIINKNMKPFGKYKNGLLELKLLQLIKAKNINEIVLSTNDKNAVEIAEKIDPEGNKVKIDLRPEYLCLSSTKLKDLVNYVPKACSFDHILWGHVTTPFANSTSYDNIIETYFEQLKRGFDSLVTGVEHQNFFFNPLENKMLHEKSDDQTWPRTQDLDKLFEVNHVAFINSKENYIHNQNRIGNNPYFMSMGKLESMDIDWEEDFEIADTLAKHLELNL